MVYLTRIEHFNAAHKLYNPNWSKEKNHEVFGKCANENWHGHNFELFVTIKGDPDPETGFIFDAKKLGGLINEKVIEKLEWRALTSRFCMQPCSFCMSKQVFFARRDTRIFCSLNSVPHLPAPAGRNRLS